MDGDFPTPYNNSRMHLGHTQIYARTKRIHAQTLDADRGDTSSHKHLRVITLSQPSSCCLLRSELHFIVPLQCQGDTEISQLQRQRKNRKLGGV